MKRLGILVVLGFLVIPNASAETLYVDDFVRVTLRSGPGVDYRVIDMVGTGEKVQILERAEDWSKVQVSNGKEGWILTRHLTSDVPSVLLVETFRRENAEQKTKLADLSTANARLAEEARKLKKELEENRTELTTLQTEHESLKQGSGEYLDLKVKYEKAAAALEEVTQRAEGFEKDLTRLQLHQNVRWFLSGAGVLVVGFLIGFSAKRQRRRSSLL